MEYFFVVFETIYMYIPFVSICDFDDSVKNLRYSSRFWIQKKMKLMSQDIAILFTALRHPQQSLKQR